MCHYLPLQGQQKQCGCSGFGQSSFTQGKIKLNFYKKQVLNKSASVIFGLVRLIVLSYNGRIEKVYQEVLDYRLPMHFAYKIYFCARS